MREEDLKYIEFWPRVWKLAEKDRFCQEAKRLVDHWEPKFDAVMETLTEEQRNWVTFYVASYASLQDEYALVAYEMGRREGPRKPEETYRDWVEDPKRWEPFLDRNKPEDECHRI